MRARSEGPEVEIKRSSQADGAGRVLAPRTVGLVVVAPEAIGEVASEAAPSPASDTLSLLQRFDMRLARLEWCVVVLSFYGPTIVVASLKRYFSAAGGATGAAAIVDVDDAVNDMLYFLPRLTILAFLAHSARLKPHYFGTLGRRLVPRICLLVVADRALGQVVFSVPAFPLPDLKDGIFALAQYPADVLLVNCAWLLCGAVFEEFTRAYVINRAGDVWGSRKLGVVASAALFTLGHVYYTDSSTLAAVALTGGVLYSLAYFWWNDVWAMVVAHFSVNVFITAIDAANA